MSIRYFYILSLLLIVIGCSQNSERISSDSTDLIKSDTNNTTSTSEDYDLARGRRELKDHFIYGEIRYSAALITSRKFLERKGTSLPQDEIDDLKNEYVLILDLKSISQKSRSPFDLEQCQLPKDKAIKRFSFDFENLIYITSPKERIFPSGSHFERDFGLSDRIRLVCFFTLNSNSDNYTLHINDQLFGAGERIIELKKPELI